MARIDLSYDPEDRVVKLEGYRSDGSRLGPPMFRKLKPDESLGMVVEQVADGMFQCGMLDEAGRAEFIAEAMTGAGAQSLSS